LWGIINDEFIEKFIASEGKVFHLLGFFRDSMLYNNIDRYFEKIGTPFSHLTEKDISFYSEKYGREKVLRTIKSYGVDIDHDMYEWEEEADIEDDENF